MLTAATPAEQTDETLAELVAARHESDQAATEATRAFEELYRRHSQWLLSILAARVHRNDVEDMHQVVWQRVWDRAATGFRGGRFQVWLYHIARNHLIDCSRRRKESPMGAIDANLPATEKEPPSSRLEQAEAMNQLHDGLAKLGKRAARVMRLRLDGAGFDLICRELRISRQRAYRLLYEARIALQDSLGKAGAQLQ